jgi:chromosomal replication initiation ATPase DnaA
MRGGSELTRGKYFPPVLSTRDVVERMAKNPIYEAMITADFILPGRLKPQGHTWDTIIEEVACRHSVTVEELMSKSRKWHVARARFDAWAQIYATVPGVSLPKIAARFGTDHSTVRHGILRFKMLSEGGYMP